MFLCLFTISQSQWSTSSFTKDAIYACWGFQSKLIPLSDGGCIAIGLGSEFQQWMQRFDEKGYRQWSDQIVVLPPYSKGLRFYLPDHKDGIFAIAGNRAHYILRSGVKAWGDSGKVIADSNETVISCVDALKNGFFGLVKEINTVSKIKLIKFDIEGNRHWVVVLDSSLTPGILDANILTRLGKNVIVRSSRLGTIIVDTLQMISTKQELSFDGVLNCKEGDSTLLTFVIDSTKKMNDFTIEDYCSVSKYNESFIRYWTKQLTLTNYQIATHSVVGVESDNAGGVYYYRSFQVDSINPSYRFYSQIYRLTDYGKSWGKDGLIIPNDLLRSVFQYKGNLGIIFNSGRMQKYDTSGVALWPDSLKLLSDMENAYSNAYTSDGRGGAFMTFWTTYGGIKIQHTGRVGKVGVLTKIPLTIGANPNTAELFQNYPNPFNPSTTIIFNLPQTSHVKLMIYDVIGKQITKLVDEIKTGGSYSIDFNASNLSSGVYYYQIQTDDFVSTKKLILLK